MVLKGKSNTQDQDTLGILGVNLIYVGQLEQQLHPDAVTKLAQMATDGLLTPIFTNDKVTIYAVAGTLEEDARGGWSPS